jgi:hypothetical protein
MRVADVAKLFAGSLVVYFVAAACSAAYSEQQQPPGASSGGGPAASVPPPIGPVPLALADGTKSGTRLKLRFWEGSDGSRQFIDFFDSQLQTNCQVVAYNKTSDGKVRCLPTIAGELYYSDAQCMTPALYVVNKAVDPQPKIAAVDVQPSSGPGFREHYTLKGLINAPASLFRGGKDGPAGTNGCAASPAPTGQNYYDVGPPLAPTSFVEMAIKTE